MSYKYHIILFSIFFISTIHAQEYSPYGLWKGESEFGQIIELELKQDEKKVCKAIMSLPLQGIMDIVSKQCDIGIDTINLVFKIQSKEILILVPYMEKLVGYWKQNGKRFKIDFERTESFSRNRPQEPKPPYNYYMEELSFFNKIDNINLEGILTLPDSLDRNCPC